MHLVIVKDDLSVYLHAHPENMVGGAGPINFKQSFTKPGAYRLFAQFRPRNTTLPADKAILVNFQVRVDARGSPTPLIVAYRSRPSAVPG
jgi:hypothetical protein